MVAIPLFRPEHRALLGLDVVVCVDCRRARSRSSASCAHRGLAPRTHGFAWRRRATREERVAMADEVLDNAGTLGELDGAGRRSCGNGWQLA